jgi:hypothetical protein
MSFTSKEAEAAYRRKYYERNRETICEQQRKYYERNRDAVLEREREYRQLNRAYMNRRDRKRRQRLLQIPAPRSGERYRPDEDAIIMRGDRYSLREMCYRTGRSYASVHNRRTFLRRNGIEFP